VSFLTGADGTGKDSDDGPEVPHGSITGKAWNTFW